MALIISLGGFLPASATDVVSSYADRTPPRSLGDGTNTHALPSLKRQAEREGSVRVIAGLDTPFTPEGRLVRSEARSQRGHIENVGEDLLEDLAGTGFEKIREFDTLPYVALEVSPRALQALGRSPHATSIAEDVARPSLLIDSRRIVQAPLMEDIGYDGDGQTVAVLDTGIDKSHPFLTDKVVAEACYTEGDCPNGTSSQTGAGAGAPCEYSVGSCPHGTHVAGIAAGKGVDFSGVAKEADLMSVQVFSRFNSSSSCGSTPAPCPLSYDSDQIAGLARVYALRATHDFSSVNVSIGGGGFSGNCDTYQGAYKAAVDNLRTVGIPTVIAAGNDSFRDEISSPACISSAISVGSTTDSDAISSFSNIASIVSLLAPGTGIESSVTGNGFSSWSGTSMAAPHVAGAWALLTEQNPAASVAQILGALQSSGKPVRDMRFGGTVTKPRVRIGAASAVLEGAVPYDDFASSRLLVGWDVEHAAHNIGATKEAAEPQHGGPDNAGGSSIWYRWTAPYTSTATVDTHGSNFDTLLSVYTGSSMGALTEVAGDDDVGDIRTSSVQFPATQGMTYRIAIDGYKPETDPGAMGDAILRVSLPDDDPPTKPSLVSPSHAEGVWSSDPTIEVAWAAASDTLSGVDGYSGVWDTSPTSTPDDTIDFQETAASTVSPSLVDGDAHYFHLRTRDNSGNWSATDHFGPFKIDTGAPAPSSIKALKRFQNEREFDIGWSSSSDAYSQLAGYEIAYDAAPLEGAFDGFAALGEILGITEPFSGEPGHTYCFTVTPFDEAGNHAPSSRSRCTSVPLDERSPVIERSGRWTEKSDADRFEGTYLVSAERGATLSTDAAAVEKPAVVVTKCASCGSIRVLWEGTPLEKAGTSATKVSLRAPSIRKNKIIRFEWLPAPSSGTIEIEVRSSGKPVMIEGLGLAKA